MRNREAIRVLPPSTRSAAGDPHIVLFVIIHLVDFALCNLFLFTLDRLNAGYVVGGFYK